MDKNILDKESFLIVEYASCDGSQPRNEFEIKKEIISELRKLKSDKPWSTNSISIDQAISIVANS